MIKTDILPKSFCREFIDVRGHSSQIVMYMSLVLGFKPFLDDWILKEKLSEFKKVCNKYNIYVKEDVITAQIPKNEIKGKILGKELITTTSAYGFPANTDLTGSVHVFLSKSKRLLTQGMWYPLIVKNRLIPQPRADTLGYGYVLGYPDCCVRFFKKYNNWNKYSYLYEIYKNSNHRKRYHFYCNPCLKDAVYSYIYHMPCSFQCEETIKLVSKLRRAIRKKEPEFVETIDRLLQLPLLVFYERKFYLFEGKMVSADQINYSNVYFPDADQSSNLYQKLLSQGNRVKLKGREVVIYKNNQIIDSISVPFTEFASEYPYMIQFS